MEKSEGTKMRTLNKDERFAYDLVKEMELVCKEMKIHINLASVSELKNKIGHMESLLSALKKTAQNCKE